MSVMMSSVIERPNIANMFCGFYGDESTAPKSSSRISDWADAAIGTCMAFAERTCAPQPHFNWLDSNTVVIAPSDYQFLFLNYSDLVLIEDEDLLFRDYCFDAISEFEQYREFGDGWDGEDMPAPLDVSLDDAFTFLRLLSFQLDTCAQAIPMLDHEGISSVAFENATDYLSIAFYGDNRIVVYRWNSITDQNTVVKNSLDDSVFLKSLIQDIEKI